MTKLIKDKENFLENSEKFVENLLEKYFLTFSFLEIFLKFVEFSKNSWKKEIPFKKFSTLVGMFQEFSRNFSEKFQEKS